MSSYIAELQNQVLLLNILLIDFVNVLLEFSFISFSLKSSLPTKISLIVRPHIGPVTHLILCVDSLKPNSPRLCQNVNRPV